MMSTNHPDTPTPHPQKVAIDLLFQNNKICKHVTDFKTFPPPFPVDVINIRSLTGNIFLKKSE